MVYLHFVGISSPVLVGNINVRHELEADNADVRCTLFVFTADPCIFSHISTIHMLVFKYFGCAICKTRVELHN